MGVFIRFLAPAALERYRSVLFFAGCAKQTCSSGSYGSHTWFLRMDPLGSSIRTRSTLRMRHILESIRSDRVWARRPCCSRGLRPQPNLPRARDPKFVEIRLLGPRGVPVRDAEFEGKLHFRRFLLVRWGGVTLPFRSPFLLFNRSRPSLGESRRVTGQRGPWRGTSSAHYCGLSAFRGPLNHCDVWPPEGLQPFWAELPSSSAFSAVLG